MPCRSNCSIWGKYDLITSPTKIPHQTVTRQGCSSRSWVTLEFSVVLDCRSIILLYILYIAFFRAHIRWIGPRNVDIVINDGQIKISQI